MNVLRMLEEQPVPVRRLRACHQTINSSMHKLIFQFALIPVERFPQLG